MDGNNLPITKVILQCPELIPECIDQFLLPSGKQV